MTLEIPQTRLRLQNLIKVSGGLYNSTEALPDFTSIKFQPIGAVQKFSMGTPRTISHWRELNSDDFQGVGARPIMETYPGLPTYELMLHRIVLYESNILESIGLTNEFDVIQQWQPLALQIFLPVPTGSTAKQHTIFFYGCWLENNPLEFDVNADDLKMIQEVGIKAAGLVPGA